MNIQTIREFFIPDFSEFQEKVLKVNFLTLAITFAITFIFSLLGFLLPDGSIIQKLIVVLLSPLITLLICPLILAYVLVLYLINIFKVQGNKFSNYFNMGSSFILMIFQLFIVITAYVGSFLQMPVLMGISGLVMQYMILAAFFVMIMNLFYASGVGIMKFVKNIRGY